MRARREPLVIGLVLQADLVVKHPQIAVPAAHDRFRHDRLNLLRHDADVGLVAADIAEAIKAQTVIKVAEKADAVLERNVGTPSTASTAATTTAATSTGTSATAATPTDTGAAASSAAKACTAALGVLVRRSARLDVS